MGETTSICETELREKKHLQFKYDALILTEKPIGIINDIT